MVGSPLPDLPPKEEGGRNRQRVPFAKGELKGIKQSNFELKHHIAD
jgi:hypothetical protein